MSALALLLGAGLLNDGAAAEAPARRGDRCAGAQAAVSAAAEALDKGEWADSERLLSAVASSHADCSGVALGLARIQAARGDAAEAERLFTRAAELAPEAAIVHARFAEYWLSRGRQAPADYLSSLALSLDPDCAEALVVQAQLLSSRSQPDAARRALEKAASLEPDNVEARYRLGIWFFRAKLHGEAVGQFERVIARRPRDARAHDFLALSLQALGEAERAELAYRSGLKVNEGPFADPLLHYNYGRLLLKQNRLEECRSQLDRAVALLPDRRGPHYERGKLHLALKEYAAARRDAERALGLQDPGGLVLDLQVYYLLATVYARLGETALARKYAELSRTTEIPDQAADRRE